MILCLCSYRTEEDIDRMRSESSSKEEFANRIKKSYKCGDCRTCYQSLISKYEQGSESAEIQQE